MAEKNKITLVGVVTDNIKTDLQYGDEVLYKTYLQVNRANGRPDKIMIVGSKEQFTRCRVEIGLRVSIEGEIETRNEYDSKRARKVVIYVRVRSLIKAFREKDRNEVMLVGSLCNKPTTWKTQDGQSRTNFTLAVEDDTREIVSFIPCVTWTNLANKAETLEAGELIIIKGKFCSRPYNKTTKTGQKEKAIAYEVQVNKLI